jgi:DNA mismatch repair ATPase MutL
LEIDVRIKDNGIKSVEVIDNGCGIANDDYDTVGGISQRRRHPEFDGIH